MATINIKPGTKLAMAYDVPVGSEPDFSLVCTFNKLLDESAFLISVPMKGGRPLKIDEEQKLLIRYGSGAEQQVLAGYADDEITEGIRHYWKIRRVSETRQFFQRADERLKVALRAEYMQDTWATNAEGGITKDDAMTLDISAGGLAMYLNHVFDVGEICMVTLPRVGTTAEGNKIEDIVSAVCWERDAPKGSLYRHICGLQFRFSDELDRKKVQDYVACVKKRYKL